MSSIWSLEVSLHLSLIVLCIIVSWKSGDYGLFSFRKFSLWAGQISPNKQPLRTVLVLHSLWRHLLHIIQPVLWILNYWIPCGLFMAFTAIISEQFANTSSLHYEMKSTVLFLFHRAEGSWSTKIRVKAFHCLGSQIQMTGANFPVLALFWTWCFQQTALGVLSPSSLPALTLTKLS